MNFEDCGLALAALAFDSPRGWLRTATLLYPDGTAPHQDKEATRARLFFVNDYDQSWTHPPHVVDARPASDLPSYLQRLDLTNRMQPRIDTDEARIGKEDCSSVFHPCQSVATYCGHPVALVADKHNSDINTIVILDGRQVAVLTRMLQSTETSHARPTPGPQPEPSLPLSLSDVQQGDLPRAVAGDANGKQLGARELPLRSPVACGDSTVATDSREPSDVGSLRRVSGPHGRATRTTRDIPTLGGVIRAGTQVWVTHDHDDICHIANSSGRQLACCVAIAAVEG